MRVLKQIVCLLFLLSTVEAVLAQTLTDGPIQLQVRTRRINTTFNATDEGVFGVGFRPDELTYYMWARDNADLDGAGWLGGACLQANFNPPALSQDFNYLMFNYTYPTANVPQFFDIRLRAWEDDRNSDAAIGLTCGGNRCNFDGNACCGFTLLGACIGFTESDDFPCLSDPFRNQMNYRLGPPCQWYNHGFVTYNGSGCASNFYQPEIESFWRYTRGTSCANPIQLGALTAGPGLSHFNSNVCYSNNFSASPGNDVFYSFTIAQPTRIIASVCGAAGAQFDSYLYVLDSGCSAVASNDNDCGNQSRVITKVCSPGTYYVVVDGATAAAQGTFTLSLQIDPTYNFSTNINRTNVTCNGEGNGTATANPTGGATPYIYVWSNGGNGQTTNNLTPGTYTVTVTDADGCTSTASTSITQPTELNATISKTDVTCSGANDGTATVAPSGGTPGYAYRWNSVPIQTAATAIFLQPTSYTVTVTDANNCSITRSISLNTNSTINLTLNSLQQINCNGENNGAIDINVSGGFSPYTYSWSNGAVSQDVNNLSPGSYTVTVRDNSLCSVTASYSITQPPVLTASVSTVTDAFCNGSSDGSITTTVLGGVQPYTYLWSNGATTQNLINVAAGNYSLTITDANGCTVTVDATVNEPAILDASLVSTNPTCSGANNGNISVTTSGGALSYTYLWSTGDNTASINNLSEGNYNVLILDANGCFRNLNTTLVAPPPVSIQNTSNNIICNGGNDGSISLTASGGTPTYTYAWSSGQNTATISPLTAGNYTVTVSDANLCTASETYTISEPPVLLSNIVSATNITCNGYSDGAVQVAVSGGVPPYNFLWSNGATTQSLVSVAAGNYEVTITDANGCSSVLTQQLTEPAGVTISAATTNVACNGFADGEITLTVTGGATPYTFLWSNGAVTQNLQNITAGNYVVVVTDANNCVKTFSATVTELQPLQITATQNNILCNGLTTGSIDITVSGGTTPNYNYQWNNGSNIDDLNNLSAGIYEVTVTDNNGCSLVSSYAITEPPLLEVLIDNTFDVTCNALSNGSITTSVLGGTQPYSFLWSNGAVTQNLTNVSGNNYSLTVTDNNNCTATVGAVVNEPAALTLQLSATSPSCFGLSDGSINAQVSGGTTPYTYNWSNGAATNNINGLSSGTYTLIVTDANNCFVQESAALTTATAIVVAETITDADCNGAANAAIQLNVSGGTAPYTYNWNNGANTPGLSGITAGNYEVTVADNSSCSVVKTFTVNEPPLLALNLITTTDVTCNGFSNGVAVVAASGGRVPYNYFWSNGVTQQVQTNLLAGNYTVTVSDNNNCTATLSVVVNEPSALTLQLTENNPNCFGASNGSISSVVAGGTAPYNYLWNNGTAASDISNVSAGNYTLIVTDANNCLVQQSTTLTSPAAITIAATITDVLCNADNNGAIDLMVSGGTTPYNFLWSNGSATPNLTAVSAGSYTVTVTDAAQCSVAETYIINEPQQLTTIIETQSDISCNGFADGFIATETTGGTPPYSYSWNNGFSGSSLYGVLAGNYTLEVVDANGCITNTSATISEPAAISIQLTATNILCNGNSTGAIDAVVSGGVAPYTYAWSNNSNSSNINNLPAGNYTLIVTDANNCVAYESITLTEPPLLSVTETITNTTCGASVGAIDITVSGGVTPYSFIWSNGSVSEDIQSLSAGSYTVTVTDANGCILVQFYTVNNIDGIVATISQTRDVTCAGDADGFIVTNITSGTLPFTYSWTNNISTTQNAFDLSGGTYAVTITDANNCTIVLGTTINEPAPLALTVNAISPQCNGDNNGSISVNVSGGTLPNTYLWSTGSTINNISGLTEGIYTIVITDLNGCVLQENIPLVANNNPELFLTKTDVLCGGDNTGIIDATVVSGTAPYTFLWNNGTATQNLNNIPAGNYSVTVTDANGCVDSATIAVNEPIATELQIITLDNLCFGNNNGIAFAVINGGIQPYTYNWSAPVSSTTEVASGLFSGNYSVTVTDSNNCEETATFTINEPDSISLVASGIINTTCYYSEDGSVVLAASGGNGPYEYSVSNNIYQNGNSFNGLAAADYTAIVLDANGCSATTTFTIEAPEAIDVVLPPAIVVFAGSSTTLTPEITGADTAQVSYVWSPATYLSCTDCAAPVMTAREEITYTVTATDAAGCSDTASVLVFVRDDFELHMPNIFSPNGDGVNDFYGPVDFGAIIRLEFRIFNRWGAEVFYTNNPQQPWDGNFKSQPASEGVYVYTIMGTFLNNETFKKKGSFTLVR